MANQKPIPLAYQPGFLLTESPLSAAGRFTGGFGVRFRRNVPEKRQGFVALSKIPVHSIPRGSFAWNDLTTRELIGVGTSTNLYAIPDTDYVPIDITPAGLAIGLVDPETLSGYGTGYYGLGPYGEGGQGQFVTAPPRIWTIGNFGRVGLFCPNGGTIYSWDPQGLAGLLAVPIPGAPTVCTGIVTTSDNIVIAYGTNYNANINGPGGAIDPLQYWNCAQGNYLDWNASELAGPNGAPSRVNRINSGNTIVGAVDLGIHVTLLWTDYSLHALQYNGSQFVFDSYPVGFECGLVGPMAMVAVGSTAYWMSQNGFFVYNGGVSPIPNEDDIKGFVFPSVNQIMSSKIICWYDQFYNEVSWAIPIGNNSENSLVVIFNISGQFWYTDTMIVQRTSPARLSSPISDPLFFGNDGLLYHDDVGLDANGTDKPWSLNFAPVDGDASWLETLGVFLETQRQSGNIQATLTAFDRTQPQSPIVDVGTAIADPATSVMDLRVAGRDLQLTLSGDGLGCDFRLGVTKIELGPSGTRR